MGYADDDDEFGIELHGWQPDMDTGAYPILGASGRADLAGQEFGVPSPRARIARLHPDRWILAIGSIAAAVTFVAAVAAAGGSTTQGRAVVPGAVVTPAVQPGCVFPTSGR